MNAKKSSVLVSRNAAPQSDAVEQTARDRLQINSTYAHYFRTVSIEVRDGLLVLSGRVPTYYMKQLLQTTLKGLAGVTEIDNGVEVVDQTSQ